MNHGNEKESCSLQWQITILQEKCISSMYHTCKNLKLESNAKVVISNWEIQTVKPKPCPKETIKINMYNMHM